MSMDVAEIAVNAPVSAVVPVAHAVPVPYSIVAVGVVVPERVNEYEQT
jgi:hypothetical protein